MFEAINLELTARRALGGLCHSQDVLAPRPLAQARTQDARTGEHTRPIAGGIIKDVIGLERGRLSVRDG